MLISRSFKVHKLIDQRLLCGTVSCSWPARLPDLPTLTDTYSAYGRVSVAWFAASSHKQLDLKSALRSLYKLVHPDLFEGHPTEREYLHQARLTDTRSPAARTPYHFSFYLQTKDEAELDEVNGDELKVKNGTSTGSKSSNKIETAVQQAGDSKLPSSSSTVGQGPDNQPTPPEGSSGAAGNQLADAASAGAPLVAADKQQLVHQEFTHVSITLPPPTPGPSKNNSDALPTNTRKALAHLLSACGLSVEGIGDLAGGPFGGSGGESSNRVGTHTPLSSWLSEAVEVLRQEEIHMVAPSVRVANLRGAFRLVRELMVSFPEPQEAVSLQQQVKALEDLSRLLDEHRDVDLRGCHILLGNRMALDRQGHLHLSIDDPPSVWLHFLQQVDVAFARQQRQHVQAIHALEASVARLLGVALIHTTHSYVTDMQYRQLLERLASVAAERGQVEGGRYHLVTLSITPPGTTARQAERSKQGLNVETGAVWIGPDATASDVYHLLQKHGEEALAFVQSRHGREAEAARLGDRVRKQLRLRRLIRDDRLSLEHYDRACRTLLQQSAALAHILEGSSMRVGFANRVVAGCLEIAWDFEL